MSGFQAYSAEHFLLMGVLVVGCVAIARAGRRLRHDPREPAFRKAFAILIPVFTVPMQVLQLLPGDFGIGTSLPLQVCDLSWMVASYALFTGDRRANQVLYYWGLTLVTQAILTPSLEEAFPDPRWWMFWGMHFLTVWAAVYTTFGRGIRPTWPGFRFTIAVTFAWAFGVMAFNALVDTNYGYLNHKPRVSSLLDYLGPWPLYVFLEIGIVIGVWALITWPWTRRTKGARVVSHAR